LLGDAELRELLDAEAMDAIEQQLQRLDGRYRAKNVDAIHDMLLAIGDLSVGELRSRVVDLEPEEAVRTLMATRRIVSVRVAAESRVIAVEDAARYRDALGVPLPTGIPESLLRPVADPSADLVLRFARTHAPFTVSAVSRRYGLTAPAAEAILLRLTAEGRLLEGEFRPGGSEREWTEPGVLRTLRRRSLAKLRHEIEPVEQAVLGRFTTTWHGIVKRRQGVDALLDVIEQLQGTPLSASILETEILPARVQGYDPADLDAVAAAGELVWIGIEPLGERDGRVALYLADHVARLIPPRQVRLQPDDELSERQQQVLDHLRTRGASFFGSLHEAVGGGYPAETVDAIWNLVWRGLITNDTFHALRAFTQARPARRRQKRPNASMFRSRRLAPPSAEGRWTLVPAVGTLDATPRSGRNSRRHLAARPRDVEERTGHAITAWIAAATQQLLARHGVLTRESFGTEQVPGGFGSLYPVLKRLEEAGRIRRGYFVAGLGATQFALPGAVDLLRSLRDPPDETEIAVLAATDPANPYGAVLPWPGAADAGRRPPRAVGATVILVNGALAAYLARGDRQLIVYLPESEPERSQVGRGIARMLMERAEIGDDTPRGMLIEEIDGMPPGAHPFGPYLVEAGFVAGALGFQAISRWGSSRSRRSGTSKSPEADAAALSVRDA
jgi:ATP-dependent Lhr-like helicase